LASALATVLPSALVTVLVTVLAAVGAARADEPPPSLMDQAMTAPQNFSVPIGCVAISATLLIVWAVTRKLPAMTKWKLPLIVAMLAFLGVGVADVAQRAYEEQAAAAQSQIDRRKAFEARESLIRSDYEKRGD
jgi:hypothetical protein